MMLLNYRIVYKTPAGRVRCVDIPALDEDHAKEMARGLADFGSLGSATLVKA